MTEVADRPSGGTTSGYHTDAALAEAVRGGDLDAYRELYTRHLGAARGMAAAIAASETERDDLIAEAFTQVLRILRSGGGPEQAFRPYLLATIRNTMIRWHRRDSLVSLMPEVPDTASDTGDDVVDVRLHGAIAAEAFAGLPERWRTVLWRTEVEGESPAQVARRLEMTPNAVAALAYRAREGLRQAYLDQYVLAGRKRACRAVGGQLAKWVRHGVTERRAHRIAAHLDRCEDCRELAAGLRRLNEELPATLAPLISGLPALAARWASTTGPAVSSGAGASALSWATVVKTATAALVTTVAIGGAVPVSAPPPVAGPAPAQAGPARRPHETVARPAQPAGAASGGAANRNNGKKSATKSPAPNAGKGNSPATPAKGRENHPGRTKNKNGKAHSK